LLRLPKIKTATSDWNDTLSYIRTKPKKMGVGAIVLGSAALCIAIALVIEVQERF